MESNTIKTETSTQIIECSNSPDNHLPNGKKRVQEEKQPLPASKKQQLSPSSSSSLIGRSFPPPAITSPFSPNHSPSPSPSSSPNFPPPLSKFPPAASIKNASPLPTERNSSTTTKPAQEQSRNQIFNQLWIWEQLIQREQSLLERFKQLSNPAPEGEGNSAEVEHKLHQIQQEVRSFFEHKTKVLMPLTSESIESVAIQSAPSPAPAPIPAPAPPQPTKIAPTLPPPSTQTSPVTEAKGPSSIPSLSISQQLSDVIIANRYIVPAPSVVVYMPKGYTGSTSAYGNQSVTLVLSASLLYHLTDKEVTKTMDGRQDILQGVKRISIDMSTMTPHPNSSLLSTTITFSKLKILEVSSKHKHQPFSLVFSIEEYVHGAKRIINTTKSTLFQVLSRPTSTHYGSIPGSPAPQNSQNVALRKAPHEMTSTKKDEKSTVNDNSMESQDPKVPLEDNSNMILQDITDLLTLPQKEAASKLGISESMLCKRFKESTRRKWPYRYLRKLEKVIKMLHLQQNDGSGTKDDREKLDFLEKEKTECLRPVKIRITLNDRIASFNASNAANSSSPAPLKKEEKNGNSENQSESPNGTDDEDDEHEGRDEDHFVLQTLEMLKSQRRS